MKFFETHFEEYASASKKQNLHPKLEKVFQKFPKRIQQFKNVIFYGPSGVGKYTQMLKLVQRYSPSELKYEKKMNIVFNKQQFMFKISDVHYEVDMTLLGCNSKLLWHDVYQQVIDVISAKSEKVGIIVCKNFHDIHSELLENFYSYMQENNNGVGIDIKFILLTEEISFLPDNIVNCCEVISVPRPTRAAYLKCSSQTKIAYPLEAISNIKNLNCSTVPDSCMYPYKIICDKIIREIVNYVDIKFLNFRDNLYDIFIFNLDITDCVWYILGQLIDMNRFHESHLSSLLLKTYTFLKYYNNNYRPIYHLENYLFYLISKVHGF